MSKWFLDLIGKDIPDLPEGGRRYLEWAGVPRGEGLLFLILFFLALLVATAVLYRREGRGPRWQKFVLGGLRVLVIVAGFLVILEPRLAVETSKTLDSVTVVLIDQSLSMTIKDRLAKDELKRALAAASKVEESKLALKSRAELLEAILANEDLALLKRLGEQNTLEVYGFSRSLRPIEPDDQGRVKLKPDGQATDLSGAVRGALEEAAGKTIAGIVVISDGKVNAGEHPSAVAGLLKERGIPIYAFGLGNPDPPKNIKVLGLRLPPRVYKKDAVLIQGQVGATGYAGEKLKVVLERQKQGSAEAPTIVQQKDIAVTSDEFEGKVEFEITPKEAGEFIFTLSIPVQADELLDTDNSDDKPMAVIDANTRVLLIAGGPSFEYRFLRSLLERERSMKLSCWLQSADLDFPQDGNIPIRELPRTREELFQYNVIVMIDPREDSFDVGLLGLLRDFVGDNGGGLCYVAGDKNTTALLRNPMFQPLRMMLPIDADLDKAEIMTDPGRAFVERWGMSLTAEGEDHEFMRLSSAAAINRGLWERLPGFFWHYPVRKETPEAAVLLRSKDPTRASSSGQSILLSTRFFGPGRTVFAAFDSTWRWRAVARRAYEHYWIQLIRYLAKGQFNSGQRRVDLQLNKEKYALGDVITAKVKVLDKAFKPMAGARLTGLARSADGDEFEVRFKPDPARAGSYLGQFVPPKSSAFSITVSAPDLALGTGKPVQVSKQVRVSLPRVEFDDPRLDAGLLRETAEASGGAYIPLKELAGLPDKIPPKRETLTIAGNPIPLWDTRLTLILMVLLLSLEWVVRKRVRMA